MVLRQETSDGATTSSRSSSKYSAQSKPMPPAPIIATRSPHFFLPDMTSSYVNTFSAQSVGKRSQWYTSEPPTLSRSTPGMLGIRGTHPVASTSSSKSPSLSVSASTDVFNFTVTCACVESDAQSTEVNTGDGAPLSALNAAQSSESSPRSLPFQARASRD